MGFEWEQLKRELHINNMGLCNFCIYDSWCQRDRIVCDKWTVITHINNLLGMSTVNTEQVNEEDFDNVFEEATNNFLVNIYAKNKTVSHAYLQNNIAKKQKDEFLYMIYSDADNLIKVLNTNNIVCNYIVNHLRTAYVLIIDYIDKDYFDNESKIITLKKFLEKRYNQKDVYTVLNIEIDTFSWFIKKFKNIEYMQYFKNGGF